MKKHGCLKKYALVFFGCMLSLPILNVVVANASDAIEMTWLDKHINPAQNFYQYATGGWQQQNPIPAAYSQWDIDAELDKRNQDIIHQMLADYAKKSPQIPNSIEQKVVDFYESGMDVKLINTAGLTPLANELVQIDNIKNIHDLQDAITHLQKIGVNVLFSFSNMHDLLDSSQVIGALEQDGLGLPGRDYYLKKEAPLSWRNHLKATSDCIKSTHLSNIITCVKQTSHYQLIRNEYIQHVENTLALSGINKKLAAAGAKQVMMIETELAKVSMSLADQSDPKATYHKMDMAELAQLVPLIAWSKYFSAWQLPEIKSINIGEPDFFKNMNVLLQSIPLTDWKFYLRWHLLNAYASYLTAPFVDEDFHMQALLSGAKTLLPRWQQVLIDENFALGFAIGQLYVQKQFSAAKKIAVLKMIQLIRDELRKDLATSDWMEPATRAAAIKKLDAMVVRVGYPDKWRDYSDLKIDRGPYALNVMRANEFEQQRQVNQIGKPVDKDEWTSPPQTVNAYYDIAMNSINFYAGILQPPYFDLAAPAAVNYGRIGSTMGHEMTHGFDAAGSQFDGAGNLKNWWTVADRKKFQAAADCIVNQFSQYTVGGEHVQGKLVLDEAIADLGGLILSLRAFQALDHDKKSLVVDGFTPDQQFFLAFAQQWATNISPEAARLAVLTDVHPPVVYRVNGTLANMQQFQDAYSIRVPSPMINTPHCVIW
jgi:putative endopeptidase